MTRRIKPLVLSLSAGALALGPAAPAEAIQFSSSSATKQGGIIVPLSWETPRVGPISIALDGRFVPGLSSLLGPAKLTSGLNELSSSLGDASINVYYHQSVLDTDVLGHLNATVAPYIGVRYMGALTTEGALSTSNIGAAASYSQFGGLNYGVRAYSELPLGFTAFAHAGLTTLVNGGWDQRRNGAEITSTGKVAAGGTTMPSFGLGLGWGLFGLIGASVGYEAFGLPLTLRTHGNSLVGGQALISSLSLGVRLLVLSF